MDATNTCTMGVLGMITAASSSLWNGRVEPSNTILTPFAQTHAALFGGWLVSYVFLNCEDGKKDPTLQHSSLTAIVLQPKFCLPAWLQLEFEFMSTQAARKKNTTLQQHFCCKNFFTQYITTEHLQLGWTVSSHLMLLILPVRSFWPLDTAHILPKRRWWQRQTSAPLCTCT